MLGRLAKWLRALGYDTHYQRYYRPGDIEHLVKEGRLLLSRHRGATDRYTNAALIHAPDSRAERKGASCACSIKLVQ